MSGPSERVLASAIDDLVDSYANLGNTNHPEGLSLPSRSEISRLLEDLLSLVFPGYFVQEQTDPLTYRWYVGERCARVLRNLEGYCCRAISAFETECERPIADDRIVRRAHEVAIELIQALPSLRKVLYEDVRAALAGDPAARSASEVILSYPGMTAIAVHRIAHHLVGLEVPLLPRMMSELVHSQTGIDIHPGATIGRSFFIDHGTGLVIGETCVIGERVKLYQGVTLGALSVRGGREPMPTKRHPTLEDEVTIYAGATILGGDTIIGRGSTIGGNVWLTHSVPAGTTVMLDKPSLRFKKDGKPLPVPENQRDPEY